MPSPLVIGIIILAALMGIGSRFVGPFKGKPDNAIEQQAEKVIKDEIDIDIDLSPDSKDSK